jgi:2-polyprenyl-6-hydroxyphenyl methylase/3-demethylubiquinone-9 3-methyltransferase
LRTPKWKNAVGATVDTRNPSVSPPGDTQKQQACSWDHTSHERFYDYYAKASQSAEAVQRFRSIQDCVLRIWVEEGKDVEQPLEVADIGCGAGAQSMIWAERGHHVHGLDVNEPLLQLARERARRAGFTIDFQVGSAVKLPWADGSMDICLLLELLEHVAEWQACLNEAVRILRPGGILFLTTSNKLCPVQQEFTLPAYSWYPAPLKRYYERLAVTSRPALVNFARYPAVNWFSFYSLRRVLAAQGFRALDRFDVMDLSKKGALAKLIVFAVRAVSVLRYCAHVATPGTMVVAIKGNR